MALAQHLDRLTRVVDWFIPADISANREQREKARIFLYSHVFGPFIGNTVPLSILLFDATTDYRVITLAGSITAFWIFPPLLRFWGHYYILSIASVQNLIFCILWSCYFYGGLSSPTVAWMLTIPLLSFMYVGPSARLRAILIAQFTINAFLYYAICVSFSPPHVTLASQAQQALGLISTAAACAYVTLMALSYANALASQVELQHEMEQHLETAADLLAATEDARRSSTAKSDFIAKMSHELRTPLNAIIGYSEILLDDSDSDADPTSAQDLRRIHDAGRHLLKLVNKILDLSRIEAGRMEVASEVVDCGGLIEAAAQDLAPLAEKNGNSLSVVRSPDLGLVSTDPLKLKQALANLIENAVVYTRNGAIVVSGERVAGDRIAIRIADNGPGIKPERLPHVLNNFDSLDDEKEDNAAGGAGLGLPLSRRLCELLDARLNVESELGKGTVFTVLLPAKCAAPAMADAEPERRLAQADHGVQALSRVGAAMRASQTETSRGEANAKAVAG
jgi:signal transduction histidine kinase